MIKLFSFIIKSIKKWLSNSNRNSMNTLYTICIQFKFNFFFLLLYYSSATFHIPPVASGDCFPLKTEQIEITSKMELLDLKNNKAFIKFISNFVTIFYLLLLLCPQHLWKVSNVQNFLYVFVWDIKANSIFYTRRFSQRDIVKYLPEQL